MWFKRKPRNRSLERRHVLDVKVARRQVVRMRVRVATLAAGLSLGTVFLLYVVWRSGNAAMNHFVYDNKAFAIEQIDIKTDGVISVDQLRRWAGARPGQNLFSLDLTEFSILFFHLENRRRRRRKRQLLAIGRMNRFAVEQSG